MNYPVTPYFAIDWDKTVLNAEKMKQLAQRKGVRLRPHVKTHKTIEIAHLQINEVVAPITVSTLAELEFYLKHGFKDITYAVPITVEKLKIALQLPNFEGAEVGFLTDSLQVVTEIGFLKGIRVNSIKLWVKINSGANRAGLEPNSEELFELCSIINSTENLEFAGLLTHAGQSYQTTNSIEKQNIAQIEVDSIVNSANELEKRGIIVKERSIGSTPTMKFSVDYTGITEIRPGNYIWYDAFQFERGNCTLDEIACVVVASVIGVYPERETILIDAGALALSKDVGFYSDGAQRYGLIKEYPEWNLVGLSQEHGVVKASAESCKRVKIGEKVSIYPNHSCLTAACFQEYLITKSEVLTSSIKPVKFF